MSWGRNSLILAIAIGNGAVLAALLWRAGAQRAFLRPLAALVALIALRLVPYAIGFAGAYDQFQWLTFAPFDYSLAFGPLVWLYVTRLATGAWPRRWRWHMVPVLVQLGYQCAAFALPLETKWNWYTGTHRDLVEPIGFAGVIVSLVAYVVAGWRQFAGWQRWMDDHLSNREAYRLGVVRVVFVGTASVVVLAAIFALRSWLIAPTDYFDRLPMMLALALLAYVLGLSGWQQSAMEFPAMSTLTDLSAPAPEAFRGVPRDLAVEAPNHAAAEELPRVAAGPPSDLPTDLQTDLASDPHAKSTGRPRQDYAALGADWRQRTIAERWYREPTLTLPDFANKLNVSPRTASRVLRDGLGLTFNAFVNGLRVEDVRQQLADPANSRDLLPIALDAGFASKASFNRAFRDVTGVSPSRLRAANAQ
jgi:AraC-like DNA-binding protein